MPRSIICFFFSFLPFPLPRSLSIFESSLHQLFLCPALSPPLPVKKPWDSPTRRRLSSFHLSKKLIEDPDQRVVIFGSENLCHENSTFGQKLDSKLERLKDQFILSVSILNPGCSYVWSSIVEYSEV